MCRKFKSSRGLWYPFVSVSICPYPKTKRMSLRLSAFWFLTSVRLLFACSRVFISISAPLIVVFILVCHLCKKKTWIKVTFCLFLSLTLSSHVFALLSCVSFASFFVFTAPAFVENCVCGLIGIFNCDEKGKSRVTNNRHTFAITWREIERETLIHTHVQQPTVNNEN